MPKQNLRWMLIAILFIVVTFAVTRHATQTPNQACRPFPKFCQPETHPPPCQPLICPDADTRETRADHTRRPL